MARENPGEGQTALVITGARNATLARLATLLPRTTVLRMVRNLQSPA